MTFRSTSTMMRRILPRTTRAALLATTTTTGLILCFHLSRHLDNRVAETAAVPAKDVESGKSQHNCTKNENGKCVVGATHLEPALFHGECTTSLIHTPKVPYPAWDYNWDDDFSGRHRQSNKAASLPTTRHVILVRHGQYEQGHVHDNQQVLTPLGRQQAEHTGRRLAHMMTAISNSRANDTLEASPCRLTAIHVSDMARAKETASIIASHLVTAGSKAHTSSTAALQAVTEIMTEPDPLLNEALPAPIIPNRPDVGSLYNQEQEIRANHDRIEKAFQKYIHRAQVTTTSLEDHVGTSATAPTESHEFEIIVCHGNVIRYFLLRALQLPPEAWLRLSLFNCSLSYIVIQPNGHVTVRLAGDTGHIPYEETTFSGSYGYNWAGPTTANSK